MTVWPPEWRRPGRHLHAWRGYRSWSGFAPEIIRLEKEANGLRGEINRAHGMLTNRQFLEKAPAEVVAQQKSKKEDYEAQLDKVAQQLDYLKQLK